MSAPAIPAPSPLPAQSPNPQGPDDLKNLVSDVLRKRGVLGSLKAQLRSSVFAILKSPDDAASVTLPLENAKVTALRATKEGLDGRDGYIRGVHVQLCSIFWVTVFLPGRQSLLLVRDLLKTLGLEYTLAVFEPEVHLDDDDVAQNATLLNALSLPTSSTPSAKPLLTQLLERSAHHPATTTTATPLSKPFAPLHKPLHPPPPLPPPTSPSGPPPTKELPSPPKAASATPATVTSSWPTLTPPEKKISPPPQAKASEVDYEDDGFDEDDGGAAGDMADLDRILGGGADDEMEESDDPLSEQKHPGPVSVYEEEDDDEQPVVFSPSEVEVMTSDRSVSPETAQAAAGFDHSEDVEVGSDDEGKGQFNQTF
ncbi:FGFR1 oncoprotein partner [Geranomyces variabilis]|nr:FGFR1 oncoprotein partner [Geranomyces variabilis]